MSYNRLLSLTYNGVTIGRGSTIAVPDGAWSVTLTPETGMIKMRFVVGDINGGTALSAMATIQAAFSVRRKRLQIIYNNATTIDDANPTIAALTGYETFPEIRHGPELPGPHSLGAETYEITLRFRRPADNQGRRDEHPAIDKSLARRRTIRFDGVWTAVAGQAAREQFEDASNGFEPHATTFLAGYDNSAQWVETVHNVIENDTDTEVAYHIEFSEHVHGQLNEERTVHQDLHNLRRVLVLGTWVDPAGVQSSSAYAAQAAFEDAGTGFLAQITAWLAAVYPGNTFALYALDPKRNVIDGTIEYSAELWETQSDGGTNTGRRFSKLNVETLPSGRHAVSVALVYMRTAAADALVNFNNNTDGALAYLTALQTTLKLALSVVNWDGFLLQRYNYNEQVGIVEAEYSFKEISPAINQGPSAARDTDLVDDQWDLISTTVGPGDSPVVLGGNQTTTSGGTTVQRPLFLEAVYRVWVKQGVDPMTKWTAGLQSYVIQQVNAKLKPAAAASAAMRIVPEVDPVNNVLSARISLESFAGTYLELSIEENVSRDFGLIFTPKLSGDEDDYLEQQGPSMGAKVRTTRLLTTQSGAIDQFMSPNSVSGYRRLRYSVGSRTLVLGIAPLQKTIYAYELVEEFLAVKSSGGTETTNSSGGHTQTKDTSTQGDAGGGNVPAGGGQAGGAQGANGGGAQGANGGGNVPASSGQHSGGNLSEFGPGSTQGDFASVGGTGFSDFGGGL